MMMVHLGGQSTIVRLMRTMQKVVRVEDVIVGDGRCLKSTRDEQSKIDWRKIKID